jgi:glucose/arabinose dehydrogenase
MEVSAIRRASIWLAAAPLALLVSMVLAAPSSAVTVSALASGLDNPRGLAFDSDGDLFVAEAGHGSEPAGKECVPGGPGGPEESTCAGSRAA